jgi:quinohemoprotein ethanol dehydrogenase
MMIAAENRNTYTKSALMTEFVSHALSTTIAFMLLLASGASAAASIDDAALANEQNTEDWLGYGRTYSEQRFSPLEQVSAKTVEKLSVDWFVDLPDAVGLVATPLVADGIMYFVSSRNIVYAVEATSGRELWRFDPKVAEVSGRRMRVSYLHGSRGVALWDDKVFLATVDGRLIGLNATTGKQLWSTMTVDPGKSLYISGAPKVFKGKVLIGNGGTENGPVRGYVTAYDADTGEQAWRFWIVPGNPADGFENDAMKMAAKTWTGEWWKHGGGGNAWHGFTYDPEFNTVYIGTGNGAPWNRKIRSPGGGDNLFLCSVVALDADTGEYKWHYQTTPGETWDYNSNMDIVLADLNIEGKPVKALLHAPKNGFFYVINRATGKLISAEPFAEVTWASHIDMKTGRPVEIPGARYEDGSQIVSPGPLGAHNWPSMSYNPKTGLAYFPTIYEQYHYHDDEVDISKWESPDFLAPAPTEGMGVAWERAGHRSDGVHGSLQAWDPVKQEQAWEVELPVLWNPGTLTTAGNLVFQGRADGDLVAYDAMTGDELWRYTLGLGIAAPPITYAIDGKQYVALLVGWGAAFAALGGDEAASLGWQYGKHMRRLVAFSLDGKTKMPALPPPEPAVAVDAPFFEVDQKQALAGADVFGQCMFCHGENGISGGTAPDLRASPIVLSDDAFANVVRDGGLRIKGMPSFENLSDQQLHALQHYIREQAELQLAGDKGSD